MPLHEEQQMMLDLVRDVAREDVEPRAAEIDATNRFPVELFAKFRELNLFGLPAPESHGGVGGDALTAVMALEELAAASPSVAIVLGMHWFGVLDPVIRAGGAPAERLASGEALGACVLGTEGPFPGVMAADLILIVTNRSDDPAQRPGWTLCEAGSDGVTRQETVEPLGWRGTGMGSVVPRRSPLKDLARGVEEDSERVRDSIALAVAAVAVGTARGAHARAEKYAYERRQFGKLLIEHGAVRQMLDRSSEALEGAGQVLHAAAADRASGNPGWTRSARLAEEAGVKAAMLSSRNAIQVHGGYGYMADYRVERFARDAQSAALLRGGTGIPA